MSVLDRYAPFVQDFIYRNRWQALRGVQVAAADVLFHTNDHLLLTASTASGKTEAAFFPILTLLSEQPSRSVGALYVGPLKALINDQFARLNELCREGEIPVWHWHGDVAQSHKNRLLKNPSGILQITPESLEALLLHRHSAVPKLFCDLRFVVIDELHALLRGDRGGQTMCLIERLSRAAGVEPRRVGLSATLGNPAAAGRFLSAGTGRVTRIPKIEEKNVVWRLSMEHFYVQGPQAGAEQAREDDREPQALPPLAPASDRAPAAADPGYGYIFEHTRDKKCLVFVNSREECEGVTTSLRQYCEAKGEPDRFLIHHGNLSAAYRETAEAVMKDEEQTCTTVTTATLELGIDIGRLERAFQLDAPATVSSFLQRMGRTGRRGQPPEMWFVMREELPEPRAMLPTAIPWKLLQGIALVQLYREERFVEPPRPRALPYSLLFHQTLAALAAGGERSPAALAGEVLTLNWFRRVTQEDYRLLLRHLLATDMIEQTETGGLIVGLAGERLVNSHKFYAVFQENEEFTVRWDSQELGTIVKPPPVGEKVALAGRVWVVEEIDYKRRLLYCSPVKGKVPAYFGECPGDVHTKVLQRMRQVLAEEAGYPYLMQNALSRLRQARATARHSGAVSEPLLCLGGNEWCLLPWLGTYGFLALERDLLEALDSGELKCSDYELAQYVLFYMLASQMFHDAGRILDELERFKIRHFSSFSKELSLSLEFSIAMLSMVVSIVNKDGKIYIDYDVYSSFEDTCSHIISCTREDDVGDFYTWINMFVYEAWNYASFLISQNPSEVNGEERLEYLVLSVQTGKKALEYADFLEATDIVRNNHDADGVLALIRSYVSRNLFLAYSDSEFIESNGIDTSVEQYDYAWWLEQAKNLRFDMMNNYKGVLDTKLYDHFRIEYYLTVCEYLKCASGKLDAIKRKRYKHGIETFLKEIRQQQRDDNVYIDKIELLSTDG